MPITPSGWSSPTDPFFAERPERRIGTPPASIDPPPIIPIVFGKEYKAEEAELIRVMQSMFSPNGDLRLDSDRVLEFQRRLFGETSIFSDDNELEKHTLMLLIQHGLWLAAPKPEKRRRVYRLDHAAYQALHDAELPALAFGNKLETLVLTFEKPIPVTLDDGRGTIWRAIGFYATGPMNIHLPVAGETEIRPNCLMLSVLLKSEDGRCIYPMSIITPEQVTDLNPEYTEAQRRELLFFWNVFYAITQEKAVKVASMNPITRTRLSKHRPDQNLRRLELDPSFRNVWKRQIPHSPHQRQPAPTVAPLIPQVAEVPTAPLTAAELETYAIPVSGSCPHVWVTEDNLRAGEEPDDIRQAKGGAYLYRVRRTRKAHTRELPQRPDTHNHRVTLRKVPNS